MAYPHPAAESPRGHKKTLDRGLKNFFYKPVPEGNKFLDIKSNYEQTMYAVPRENRTGKKKNNKGNGLWNKIQDDRPRPVQTMEEGTSYYYDEVV